MLSTFRIFAAIAALSLSSVSFGQINLTLEYDLEDIRTGLCCGGFPFWEFDVVPIDPVSVPADSEVTIEINIRINNGFIVVKDEQPVGGAQPSFQGWLYTSDGRDVSGGSSRTLILQEYRYVGLIPGAEGNADFLRLGGPIGNADQLFEIGVSQITLRNRTTLRDAYTFDRFRLFGLADVIKEPAFEPLPPDGPLDPTIGWRIPVQGACVIRTRDGCVFDPEIAIGYIYSLDGADVPDFRSISIEEPLPNGDEEFVVSFAGQSFPLIAGQEFIFGDFAAGPVSEFSVTGIDTSEMLDPEDPFAFASAITFATDATGLFDNPYPPFDLIMLPITEFVGGEPPVVDIDIKPGSDENCVNVNGNGVIPVAILGSPDVDVTLIDVFSLSFQGLAVRVKPNAKPHCSVENVNSDEFDDLSCKFDDAPDDWVVGESEATLEGAFFDGTEFSGTDSICIVPQ